MGRFVLPQHIREINPSTFIYCMIPFTIIMCLFSFFIIIKHDIAQSWGILYPLHWDWMVLEVFTFFHRIFNCIFVYFICNISTSLNHFYALFCTGTLPQLSSSHPRNSFTLSFLLMPTVSSQCFWTIIIASSTTEASQSIQRTLALRRLAFPCPTEISQQHFFSFDWSLLPFPCWDLVYSNVHEFWACWHYWWCLIWTGSLKDSISLW